MSRGINKVILIGNMGDEPIFRQTSTGLAVANISLVTNEMKRNTETGQITDSAEWHRVVLWGKLAEIANTYLHKGAQIYIEGHLRTKSYMDKQNQKRIITEIFADEMLMLGNKNIAQNVTENNSYEDKISAPSTINKTHTKKELPQTINHPKISQNLKPAITAQNDYSEEIPF